MTKLFTASWCVNCKPIKTLIEHGGYEVEVIDVDQCPDLVRDSGVRSVPSLLLDDGSLVVGSTKIQTVIKEKYGTATDAN